MKNKIWPIIALILIRIATLAPGASVIVSNNAGDSGVDSDVVVDSLFNQIGTGFVGVGYFDITDANIVTSNASELDAAFQILGNTTGSTSYDVGGGVFLDGVFEFNAAAEISTGSAFIGESIYVVVGNAAALSSSTEAFIYKTGSVFTEDPSTPISFNFASPGPPAGPEGEDPVILGTIGVTYTANWSGTVTDPINESNTAYQTVAIVPEPSAAILSALLGVLGLLRRRR